MKAIKLIEPTVNRTIKLLGLSICGITLIIISSGLGEGIADIRFAQVNVAGICKGNASAQYRKCETAGY